MILETETLRKKREGKREKGREEGKRGNRERGKEKRKGRGETRSGVGGLCWTSIFVASLVVVCNRCVVADRR